MLHTPVNNKHTQTHARGKKQKMGGSRTICFANMHATVVSNPWCAAQCGTLLSLVTTHHVRTHFVVGTTADARHMVAWLGARGVHVHVYLTDSVDTVCRVTNGDVCVITSRGHRVPVYPRVIVMTP